MKLRFRLISGLGRILPHHMGENSGAWSDDHDHDITVNFSPRPAAITNFTMHWSKTHYRMLEKY